MNDIRIKIKGPIIDGFISNTWFLFLIRVPMTIDHVFLLIHSYCMQLRRERIAERMKALQELVPSINKVGGFPMLLQY